MEKNYSRLRDLRFVVRLVRREKLYLIKLFDYEIVLNGELVNFKYFLNKEFVDAPGRRTDQTFKRKPQPTRRWLTPQRNSPGLATCLSLILCNCLSVLVFTIPFAVHSSFHNPLSFSLGKRTNRSFKFSINYSINGLFIMIWTELKEEGDEDRDSIHRKKFPE